MGFLDDVAYAAEGKDFTTTNEKVMLMVERPGGANHWATIHASEIKTNKLQAICMTRR